MNDIYSTDFSEFLPGALRHDPKMIALSKTLTEQLLTVSGSIDNVLIYSRFEELPEELVDILAYDMHVDWYDYSYPLQVKRDMVKNSVRVHKKMGTKYAVESILQSLHPESKIEEWFQYGGSPHHFRVIINADRKDYEIDLRKIISSINTYKRLSAHLEEIRLERRKKGMLFFVSLKGLCIKRKIKINPYNKKAMRRIRIMAGNAKLIYVSVKYQISEVEKWKGR